MKKRLTLIVAGAMAGLCFESSAQPVSVPVPVTDIGAIANLVQQVALSTETAASVQKQVSIMKEVKDLVGKVSRAVRGFHMMENIIQNQIKVLDNSAKYYDYLKETGEFTPDELSIILYNFTRILSATESTLALSNDIIKEGIFNMNDAERIQALRKTNDDILAARNDMNRLYRDYQVIAEKRTIVRIFGN